jgi:tRNA(His) guanylyltransferase
MKDSLGDRMKDLEGRSRYFLPRRAYTLIRLDGKAFHTYTRKSEKPFDMGLVSDMQETTRLLCANMQGCKIGYTQSDEITLVLTDFDDTYTAAWYDGNLQKIVSVSASMASAYFNKLRCARKYETNYTPAVFDSRAWSISDPWEVYNTFLWRQKDCTKNSIQMVARALASHKECTNKNFSQLNELIFQKGKNFNDYPTDCKRGAFIYRNEESKWIIDRESPIITQDKYFFFSKIPMMKQIDLRSIGFGLESIEEIAIHHEGNLTTYKTKDGDVLGTERLD